MHAISFIFLLISATALADPGTQHEPWATTHTPIDPKCQTPNHNHAGDARPKLTGNGLKYDCKPFVRDPRTNIEVFWGSGMQKANEAYFFYDKECKDWAKVVQKHQGDAQTCYDMTAEDRPWVAVMGGWNTTLGDQQGDR